MSALHDLVFGRSEDLAIEYKAWMDTSAAEARAKLARHIAALANHGGGYLVFGVDDATRMPMGETGLDRALFGQEAIAGIVRRYLDPRVQVGVEDVPHEGVSYPVLVVPSHGARPVMATADGPQDAKGRPAGIRRGGIYIRAAGPESVAIRSPDDWNALLDRCLVHRADLIGDILRRSIGASGRRPTPQAEDALVAAMDATAADFVRQSVELAAKVDDLQAVRILEAGRRFAVLGYAMIGADGDLLALEGTRRLNERVAITMHDHAYNGWAAFLPLTVPERAPQIRTGNLLGRARSFLEGMRLPATNVVGGAFDYWRLYESGIAATAESYREDYTRSLHGGPPFLTMLQVLFRFHSLLTHARSMGRAVKGVDAVLVRMDWSGLAGRTLRWDTHGVVTHGAVAEDRFVRTVRLSWPELRDGYVATLRRVAIPFLEIFPPGGWPPLEEALTREAVAREFARFEFRTVRLFND